jgi:S1-C subfamily serine protease
VNRLLDSGKLDEAVRLVVAKEDFFAANYGHPEVRGTADRLAHDLDLANSPHLYALIQKTDALQWPVPFHEWSSTRKQLERYHKELFQFVKTAPFQYVIYRPVAYDKAMAALNYKEAEIRDSASEMFEDYPMLAETPFFEAYPVPVDGGKVMRANEARWQSALAEMSTRDANQFFAAYGPYLPRSAKESLANRYFASLCPNPAKADLKTILEAYEKCREAELAPTSIPGLKVAFLQVTSPDLIRHKTLDFPLSIKMDVPFKTKKASMQKMFSHKAVKEADIVVLVNVALARVEREVESNKRIPSMYVHSYRQEDNMEYAIVQTELEAASKQYHEMVTSNSYTWGASVVEKFILQDDKVERVNAAKVRLDDLKVKMRNTPKYNRVPDYQPYQVRRAYMDIRKYATVNYYVIDKRTHQYFRDTFDFKEKAFFTVCYGMHELDKNPQKLLQTSVLEEDVVNYELEPVVVNLSDLLEQYASTPSSWKQYASLGPIQRSVAADVTRAQERFTESDFTYDKYADKRFDSVVVVRNLGKGIGTGFYVTDDLVLTNYHVVDENDYVRLKLFNEREVMGRVIARDAVLDLALIEADVKGRPVCFYNKQTLPLGLPMEVIGHPNGLQFSITRGSLSSIRKEPSINYRTAKGWVLYLQTDAAVNGGNSGGPMFYGNYVVGVADWGFLRLSDGRTAQGLNFAIHYSELFKFFDRHDVMVCKGSK